jgi:hypothetical protein
MTFDHFFRAFPRPYLGQEIKKALEGTLKASIFDPDSKKKAKLNIMTNNFAMPLIQKALCTKIVAVENDTPKMNRSNNHSQELRFD